MIRAIKLSKGLQSFYTHQIIEGEQYNYYIMMNVDGFILVMREDKDTKEFLYANGGTDYEWVKNNYTNLNYTTIKDIYNK